ncbi:precorrin-3B C(17)-methyltransferase [Halorhodospira sp. 9621]|uniref:precorrin-3B C(17)-methyltransferase n=1 Tax=Halorhodospira sp. 9621 TaxID=2899135 RepID=UPI001EE787A9|nr:precorrin-3B C(17)-methyltransferase [Halorhodospira sp. 9621]MCG5532088.1 precorrin-3B C(17)-methyltransferase [Halorhodospira sp. 9621]
MTGDVPPPGRILLVGIGPGDPAHMTARAREAIAEAEVVIGYQTYLKLIPELLEGKTVIGKAMTEELDRVEAAWQAARAGQVVALVSSGDPGVYGMAGPTYEFLLQQGWQGGAGEVQVEVVPGTSALSSCAALVGAPLTHDFCTISLSDLLTPWPVIARRLEAAGRGDFVTVLYNPASKRRQAHIARAQEILLRYRDPKTPVAVVRSAYRERQQVQHLPLEQLHQAEPSMLSTVIIGNRSTRFEHGRMVTPRGYTAKYAEAGTPVPGEQRGQSLSLGLEGWPVVLRQWLREQQTPSLEAAAAHFDVDWAEALAAVADDVAEPDTPFMTSRIEVTDLPRHLEECREWPRIRAVVRGPAGTRMVCSVAGAGLYYDGETLVLGAGGGRVELDWQRVAAAWALAGTCQHCSLELVDERGRGLLSLQRVTGRNPAGDASGRAG